MKMCEICGTKEDYEEKEEEVIQAVTLHVCESCREDRKFHSLGDFAF